jgi:hypothetical protein
MPNFEFTPDGELKIIASENSSENDFDFLTGRHKVHHKKLKTRLNNCTEWIEFDGIQEMRQLLAGFGNLESHYMTSFTGNPVEGMALRLFNPATRLWSIYWADSQKCVLDTPVVGSFENNLGHFFAKDIFNGKEILVQFQWDAANYLRPVWSQAFSTDNGKTWEWNWYMYFSKNEATVSETNTESSGQDLNVNRDIRVIELRNYILKPGMRDRFINYFEKNFITSQNEMGAYTLGQFRVKGKEEKFFWIRGFADMESRSKFLPAFYYGPVWKQFGTEANSMLVNNDNVHLLKPLTWDNHSLIAGKSINSNEFKTGKGIAVIDFYIANNKLDKLIATFSENYMPVLKENGIEDCSLWISELSENDFPGLPVFQDKNLLVAIHFYKDELEYHEKLKKTDDALSNKVESEMQDIITTKSSLILYATEKSFTR